MIVDQKQIPLRFNDKGPIIGYAILKKYDDGTFSVEAYTTAKQRKKSTFKRLINSLVQHEVDPKTEAFRRTWM